MKHLFSIIAVALALAALYAIYTSNWLALAGFTCALTFHYTTAVVGRRMVVYLNALERGLPVLKQVAEIIKQAGEENKPVLH